MDILKDLPPGTIWPHLLEAVARQATAEIEDYAAARRNDVARGAETAELAALLVEKYGSGMAKALQIVGIDSTVQGTTDRLVREIDSNFEVSRATRWAARPAGVSVASSQ